MDHQILFKASRMAKRLGLFILAEGPIWQIYDTTIGKIMGSYCPKSRICYIGQAKYRLNYHDALHLFNQEARQRKGKPPKYDLGGKRPQGLEGQPPNSAASLAAASSQ